MRSKTRYFIAVFGKKYAKEHPIHGGSYPINPNYGDANRVSNGSVMLVYCTEFYEDEAGHIYNKESPGIAQATYVGKCKERICIRYDYEPFGTPIERVDIMSCLLQDEKNNFINPGNKNNLLREISPASFQRILKTS